MTNVLDRIMDSLSGMRHYTVKPGDNLATISQKFYGRSCHALVIYQHNRDVIGDPNSVYPGQHLVIPHIGG